MREYAEYTTEHGAADAVIGGTGKDPVFTPENTPDEGAGKPPVFTLEDTPDERACTFFLSHMDKLTIPHYEQLMMMYGSAAAAWRQTTVPLPGPVQEQWTRYHSPGMEDYLADQMAYMNRERIRFLMRTDPEYPEAFRLLPDPPVGIYVRGRLPEPGATAVAVIGARKCTPYGKACATRLAAQLAGQGIWNVSGMALGVDAWGQWGALDAGGPSLGILGSGIDEVYPTSHRRLYEVLVEKGGVLSEYPPGTKGLPFHFPMRNRLISAMSSVIIVVEARLRSGTLITVDQALEQGKDVLAVPGRVDDVMSEGCLRLLRQGAGICLGQEDVYYALGWSEERIRLVCGEDGTIARQNAKLSRREKLVWDCLSSDPIHLDELMETTGLSMGELMVELWNLECKKLCSQVTAGTYIRTQGG